MIEFSLLVTALLFGGMVLYSFGFAAFLFTNLPPETAGSALRSAFPHFYLFVITTAGIAGLAAWPNDQLAALILGLIAISTVPTRQILMPAINQATDSGNKGKFKALHGLSVLISLAHIAASGYVLLRFVQG